MPSTFRLDPFVSIPLLATPSEYPNWSTQMRYFLENKELWSQIEDTSSPDDRILFRPPKIDVEQYNAWTRQRQLVGTYLKTKLSPPMRRMVEHTADGNEIWAIIQRHCQPEKPDFATKFNLGARLAACKGEDFGSTYDYAQAYSKLLELKVVAGVSLEEDRVIGFLLGLEQMYPEWVTIQVEQILRSDHLPALSDLAFEARVWEDVGSCKRVRPAERNCAPSTALEQARASRSKLVAAGTQNLKLTKEIGMA